MKNENNLDRIIRVILVMVFFVLGMFVFVGALKIVAYVLALVILVTAITGFCLLYKLFGINTNKQ